MRFSQRFAAERARLLAALGHMTDGGVVEAIQHVGSTSVPGAPGSGVVDIALAVWPFPLADKPLTALRALGYRPVPGFDRAAAAAAAPGDGEQRFRHARRPVQLFVVESGSDRWQNFLTLRDYLAEHPAPRRPSANKARHFARLLPRADAW